MAPAGSASAAPQIGSRFREQRACRCRPGDRRPGESARCRDGDGDRELPSVLLPRTGRFGLIDDEKAFCPDPASADIFDLRDVDRGTACVVVVRPDQYVAHLLPLDGHDALADFFSRILVDAG